MSKCFGDKLKIAMLGHKRIPSREGGIEVVVEELATRMVKLGHDVTCYNRRGHHVSGKKFDLKDNIKFYKGIKIKRVITIEQRGLAAMTSSFFAAIKAAFGDYDVVHFHAEGPCAMIWLPKLFGKRCIATIHGLDHQRAKWGKFAQKYILFGEKMAVKYADEIIVLSEGVRKYFLKTYNRDTKFIPNGVSYANHRDIRLIKEKWELEKNGYILYVGRLVPEKGLKYLIDAFKKVETDKKLIIAGGASDTNEFEAEIKRYASDDERINFIGFVQGEVLQELYSNAYVYVLPSELEGMPLSLLEAMSYGNCVIGSDIPEIADVVEYNAILFKSGDVHNLKEKLEMVCQNEKITEEYKSIAAEYICNKYNWDEVTEKTISIYKGEL